MKQPIRKKINNLNNKTKKQKSKNKTINDNAILDGSGLETYFKENFLDKLEISFIKVIEVAKYVFNACFTISELLKFIIIFSVLKSSYKDKTLSNACLFL